MAGAKYADIREGARILKLARGLTCNGVGLEDLLLQECSKSHVEVCDHSFHAVEVENEVLQMR